jgi:hypothetical protein
MLLPPKGEAFPLLDVIKAHSRIVAETKRAAGQFSTVWASFNHFTSDFFSGVYELFLPVVALTERGIEQESQGRMGVAAK